VLTCHLVSERRFAPKKDTTTHLTNTYFDFRCRRETILSVLVTTFGSVEFIIQKNDKMKLALAVTLIAGASAFSPLAPAGSSTALFNGPKLGSGGMADTRDPDALVHEDPRKSISAAPSFEEYLKSRSGGAAPAAAAPAAPAPAAYAPAPAAYAPAPAAYAPAPAAYAPAPAAYAPAPAAPAASGNYGKYDDKLWDMDAKQDVYAAWNPAAPRSANNFNPFETWDGNSPDCSGFYPGEGRYKDPKRPDVNYAKMQAERVILDSIAANPKPGSAKGCPGCRT
jgi:hypothetical protein